MKIKTNELIGRPLDWAVAVCQNVELDENNDPIWFDDRGWLVRYSPSTNWDQGGPIIEREFIELRSITGFSGEWEAWKWVDEKMDYLIVGKRGAYCKTPLIAAMRCYVAFKLGDEVEVPDELIGE